MHFHEIEVEQISKPFEISHYMAIRRYIAKHDDSYLSTLVYVLYVHKFITLLVFDCSIEKDFHICIFICYHDQ